MRAAELGFTVTGYDTATGRVEALQAGNSYVEDVSSEQLRSAIESGYRATTDPAGLAGFDVAIITVPTPLREGSPDLSFIETAASDLTPYLRPGVLVVLESTTYPGTTEELLRPALEQSGHKAGSDFFLGYSPERVDPGNPKWSLTNTPKVVSGVDADSLAAVTAFYGHLVDTVVPGRIDRRGRSRNRPCARLLQRRAEELFGRAGIGGRLEDHQHPGPRVGGGIARHGLDER